MNRIFHVGMLRGLLLLAMLLAPLATAEATWVRGRGNVNITGTLDQLIIGVPPHPPMPSVATVQFNDGQKGMFSQADLGNGVLRGRAFVAGGSGSAGANPIIGETVTFNNTTGTESNWDFNFAVDGTVTTGANPIPIFQDFGGQLFRTTFIQFAFHVFPARTYGPAFTDNAWNQNLDKALFSFVKDIDGFPVDGELQNFSAALSDELTGSIPLQPGINEFDVVTVLAIQGNIPSTTDSSFDFNFLNTGELSIDSPVAFTSDSGLFLTGMNVVPEPASLVLAGLAAWLAIIAPARRAARSAS